MSFGTDPGAAGEARRKAEVFMAKAEAARAGHEVRRKSAIRRLLSRVARHSDQPDPLTSRATHEDS